jgi:hypothetical protein
VSPDLERLVGRAILDKAFRKQLLDDPDKAIADAGFQLTPDELDKVRDAARKNAQRGDKRIDEQLEFEATRAGSWN